MPSIEFSSPHPAVLLVRFPPGLADADFDSYFAHMEQTIARSTRPLAVVLDVRQCDNPSAAQRRRQGEWIRTHRQIIADTTTGIVFLMESAVLRFALSSIFLIQGMPVPYHVCGRFEEALSWAARQAGDGAVPIRRTGVR